MTTRLSDIENLFAPSDAPRTLRLSAANTRTFQNLRAQSFPGGRAHEQGGTLVADAQGRISIQNIGGMFSTAGSFVPNVMLRDPMSYRVIGSFHTHPYDRTEGSYNGVSFSGGDIVHIINNGLLLIVLQSGPRLFAYVRTSLTPSQVPRKKVSDDQDKAIQARQQAGRTFQQASRIEAQQKATMYGLAYYQGSQGVLTRVSPA